MIHQPTALNQPTAQERDEGAVAWLGALIDRFLDYIDTVGKGLGLPTSAEELYGESVKVEAQPDRFGH
jgi:hypothetical protein